MWTSLLCQKVRRRWGWVSQVWFLMYLTCGWPAMLLSWKALAKLLSQILLALTNPKSSTARPEKALAAEGNDCSTLGSRSHSENSFYPHVLQQWSWRFFYPCVDEMSQGTLHHRRLCLQNTLTSRRLWQCWPLQMLSIKLNSISLGKAMK